MKPVFLPVSRKDMAERGWSFLDVILVTGDAYVDHPSYGAAVIGRVLEAAGFKVGLIAQPDWKTSEDFRRLGRPSLFFGITAGNLDSALSNYTPHRKVRQKDYYSPGGKAGLRPNFATIVYSNKVRECFPGVPVVIGGMEASLRRLAHYSYWDDTVRRSILLDAKADLLVYGMGEKQVLEIARRLRNGEAAQNLNGIRGTVVVRPPDFSLEKTVRIPSFEEAKSDPDRFNEAFRLSYGECDPVRGRPLVQPHGGRWVIQYPPPLPMKPPELDAIYELPYARAWHPEYDDAGGVPGFEVVQHSIISHRGCAAECNFCTLYAHQGRITQSRSPESLVREAASMVRSPDFRGTISDVGGPTANLYGSRCEIWDKAGACKTKKCLLPNVCKNLKLGYEESLAVWNAILKIPGLKHLFISSGLRYDLLAGPEAGPYLEALCKRHTSGHLKVAPEHSVDSVLEAMNKCSFESYETFRRNFYSASRKAGKSQFLVSYFISAHPGATLEDAAALGLYLADQGIQPEQIQDFVPLPMTVSSCMYHTGKDPFTGKALYVAKTEKERRMQRAFLQYRDPKNQALIREALKKIGRPELMNRFRPRPLQRSGKIRRGLSGSFRNNRSKR